MATQVEARAGDGVHLPDGLLAEAEGVAGAVLTAEGVAEAEISIAFISDEEIAAMNAQYLSHPGPTDVISFPLHRPGGPPLGDLYIGADEAGRQARAHGVSLREELLRLCVHGTLHILGYEHPDSEDRAGSPMYLRQEELLRQYLARDGDPSAT